MNYEKSKVLLKKLKALHQSIDQESGFNALERDLFLQYLRELYDCALDGSSSKKKSKKKAGQSLPEHHKPESVQPEQVVTEVDTRPLDLPTEMPKELHPDQVEEVTISEEMLGLIEESDASFDKSRTLAGKIHDIGKSMGINEKIRTINELFQGQQALFENTIAELNTMADYDNAKSYLAKGVATEYKWYEDERKEKAIYFLHLVKRKFYH